MSTELCNHGGYCVRMLGHAGVCTAAPSAATLDWDRDRTPPQTEQIDTAVTLVLLDFATPSWADLNDR